MMKTGNTVGRPCGIAAPLTDKMEGGPDEVSVACRYTDAMGALCSTFEASGNKTGKKTWPAIIATLRLATSTAISLLPRACFNAARCGAARLRDTPECPL